MERLRDIDTQNTAQKKKKKGLCVEPVECGSQTVQLAAGVTCAEYLTQQRVNREQGKIETEGKQGR